MKLNLHNVSIWLHSLSLFRYRAEKCGHHTKRTGEVRAFGKKTLMQMSLNKNSTVDYCLDCISKMTIQCAWCDLPILIGDSITLYTPISGFKVPDHAVIYKKKLLQLVGCLRRNCADTGADQAGFWMPGENGRGQVVRVPTAFELLLSALGSALIVGNVHDIGETMNPKLVLPMRHDYTVH